MEHQKSCQLCRKTPGRVFLDIIQWHTRNWYRTPLCLALDEIDSRSGRLTFPHEYGCRFGNLTAYRVRPGIGFLGRRCGHTLPAPVTWNHHAMRRSTRAHSTGPPMPPFRRPCAIGTVGDRKARATNDPTIETAQQQPMRCERVKRIDFMAAVDSRVPSRRSLKTRKRSVLHVVRRQRRRSLHAHKAGKDLDMVVVPSADHDAPDTYTQRKLSDIFVRNTLRLTQPTGTPQAPSSKRANRRDAR